MAHKGCRVRRDQSMADRSQTLQYHWIDRNGWMVYCDCSKSFRIGDRVKLAVDNTYRRSKMQMNRWINLGATGHL